MVKLGIFLVLVNFFMWYSLKFRHLSQVPSSSRLQQVSPQYLRVELGYHVELARHFWRYFFVAAVATNESFNIGFLSYLGCTLFFKTVGWHRVVEDDSVEMCLPKS